MSEVSIIIPNYNNAKYLNDCINSAINQGFEFIKEIIVIDDHSTDNSLDILKSFKKKHPTYFFWYLNPKKGVQSARNIGFEKSSGKYIQWLDSDDILGKNKIKNQLKVLETADQNSIAFCGWAKFNDNIKKTNITPCPTWKSYTKPTDWLIQSWLGGGMMQTACWLVPHHFCEQNTWDETIIKNQDGIYFFNIILKAKHLYFSKNSMVFYRLPSRNNISQKKNRKAIESVFSTYKAYHHILNIQDDKLTRKALATNYTNLIAYIFPKYNDIQREAIKEIKMLGFNKFPLIGGKKFKIFQKLLGLKNLLRIKYYFQKILKSIHI